MTTYLKLSETKVKPCRFIIPTGTVLVYSMNKSIKTPLRIRPKSKNATPAKLHVRALKWWWWWWWWWCWCWWWSKALIGAIPMTQTSQSDANWCNTHTHINRTHSPVVYIAVGHRPIKLWKCPTVVSVTRTNVPLLLISVVNVPLLFKLSDSHICRFGDSLFAPCSELTSDR